MRKKICAAIVILGVLGLFNLVGAVELDKIGFAGAVAQAIGIGAILFASIRIGGFDE